MMQRLSNLEDIICGNIEMTCICVLHCIKTSGRGLIFVDYIQLLVFEWLCVPYTVTGVLSVLFLTYNECLSVIGSTKVVVSPMWTLPSVGPGRGALQHVCTSYQVKHLLQSLKKENSSIAMTLILFFLSFSPVKTHYRRVEIIFQSAPFLLQINVVNKELILDLLIVSTPNQPGKLFQHEIRTEF